VEELKYTGERIVSGEKTLLPMRIENLARYQFFAARMGGGKILDLGCGDGEGTGYLRGLADWDVYSIDIAADAVRFASKTYGGMGRGVIARVDVRRLAFEASAFDGIISVEVIEHIEHPEVYLSEARRVLKENGVFGLTTPNRLRTAPARCQGSSWRAHVREYSPSELINMTARYFPHVELWGEQIPVYEANIFRKFMRKLAPVFKRILPNGLRIRALPTLQYLIKSHLEINDIEFSKDNIDQKPTLVVICKK